MKYWGGTQFLIHSLSQKYCQGLPLPSSSHSQDNIPLQEIKSEEQPFQRRGGKGNGKDKATGVWNCNTSKRLKFLLSSFSAILGQSELLGAGDMQEMTLWQSSEQSLFE